MMPRVPGTATQGQQRVGAVPLATDVSTPFQSFTVPAAPDLSGISDAATGVFTAFAQIAETIDEDRSQADYLSLTNEASKIEQDARDSWLRPPDPAEIIAGVSPPTKAYDRGQVIGKAATRAWADQTANDFEAEISRMQNSEEYKNLRREDRISLDNVMAKSLLGYRSKALMHSRVQTKAYRAAQLDAHVAIKAEDVTATAENPPAGNKALKLLFSAIATAAKDKDGSASDAPAVLVAYTAKHDAAADILIVNLMNSQDPDRSAKATRWLDANSSVKFADMTIKMSDDKLTDLRALVAEGSLKDAGRRKGNAAFDRFGTNVRAFNEALARSSDSASDKKLQREQYKSRVADELDQQKRDLKVKTEDAVKLAREGKFSIIGEATLVELGPLMEATLRKVSDAEKYNTPLTSEPSIVNELNRLGNAVVDVDLMDPKYLGGLSASKWDYFSNRQAQLLGKTAPAVRTAQRTRTAIVTQSLKGADITSEANIMTFNNVLDDVIETIEAGNPTGVKATSQQIQNAVDMLLLSGEYKSDPSAFLGVDPDVRVFQLKAGQKFFFDDLSDIHPTALANFKDLVLKKDKVQKFLLDDIRTIPELTLRALRKTAANKTRGTSRVFTDAELLGIYSQALTNRIQRGTASEADLLAAYNAYLRQRISAAGIGK